MERRPVDPKTQMQDLTRNTTDILLVEIPMIDNELYFDVKRITDMDWNDATHEEVRQSSFKTSGYVASIVRS